MLNEHHPSHLT
jgi:hypothetical protein